MKVDYSIPDWNQQQPTRVEIDEMLRTISITVLTSFKGDPDIEAYISALEQQFMSGSVNFVQLAIKNHPVLQWYSSRHRLNEIDFVNTILLSDAFRKASGMKRIKKNKEANANMQLIGFSLTGELASLLYNGGVYNTEKYNDADSFQLASNLTIKLCDNRFSKLCYFSMLGEWSNWFVDSFWDYAYFIFNNSTNIVTVLCFTDVD